MLTLSEALHEVENADWAYADLKGQLRCPDCNSDAIEEGVAFHDNEKDGCVVVTDEVCVDCGVILSEDPACAPWEIPSPALQEKLLDYWMPIIRSGKPITASHRAAAPTR